ncbi:hypothetical protein SAMN02745121_03943 [Nannocystis exedens]|uniref:Uncharacterized protein n=1 Tax=Nannocystis exedens TaxID=54 RepID=A0A1I1ZTP5_9BACT|nr:hypothetical protein NAEX_08442 [Nannocystis exedens]SFE34728.1 hypothetical protein SAMN02745121_03943 [Nannocystis exedens]
MAALRPAARGWRVPGPVDPGAPRRRVEALAPAGTDMRRAWNTAPALAVQPGLAAVAEAEVDHERAEIDARVAILAEVFLAEYRCDANGWSDYCSVCSAPTSCGDFCGTATATR